MSNTIQIKRSSVAGKKPLPADLSVGELGINFADKKIYTKDAGNLIVELGGATTTLAWSAITGTPTTMAGYGITDIASAIAAKEDKLPASLVGMLRNDGTGTLSWSSAVAWSALTGTPTTMAGYGITDGFTLPTDAIGHLTNDGLGALSWSPPPVPVTTLAWSTITATPTTLAGYGITDGFTLPTDAKGILSNDGAGVLSWFPMPSAGMKFVGAKDPASMPASPLSGDFVIFNAAGTLSGTAVVIGDMAIYDGTKWDVIPNAQDLSGYLQAPTSPATGYMFRSGTGAVTWNATLPWASIATTPTTLAGYGITDAVTHTAALTANRVVLGAGTGVAKTSQLYSDATGAKLGVGVAPAQPLHVNGQIIATGDIIAFYSDMRLKEVVAPLNDALERVELLEGFIYKPNSLALSLGAAENDDTRVGLSAQSVQQVLPEAVSPAPFDQTPEGVSKTGDNYLTVDYSKLVPLLVESIKELSKKVDILEMESRT